MIHTKGSSGSVILVAITRILMPLLLMASVFLLLRGHNQPGGGFLGGLLAGVSFVLVAVAFGPGAARKALGVAPMSLIGWGLVFAIAAAVLPLFQGKPFFTGLWTSFPFFDVKVKVGTPLIFDIGVYLLVLGIAVAFVVNLQEIDHDAEMEYLESEDHNA
jgi:multicomponent Na+:H+ antiporter subunit B